MKSSSKYILFSSAKMDRASTRKFSEYDTRDELAQDIIVNFEEYLAVESAMLKGSTEVSQEDEDLEYSSDDIFEYIDDFFDEMVCLERQEGNASYYAPYDPNWVKESIMLFFVALNQKSRDKNKFAVDEPIRPTQHQQQQPQQPQQQQPQSPHNHNQPVSETSAANQFSDRMDVDTNDILIY